MPRWRTFFARADWSRVLQRRIWRWALAVFGESRARDHRERLLEVVEGVAELARSEGLGRDQVQMMVSYVYDRPARDIQHRAGAAYLSLLLYAESRGLSLNDDACKALQDVVNPRRSTVRRAAVLAGGKR
jgi:hypothetical protein